MKQWFSFTFYRDNWKIISVEKLGNYRIPSCLYPIVYYDVQVSYLHKTKGWTRTVIEQDFLVS